MKREARADLLLASLSSASLPFSASFILKEVDCSFIRSPLGVLLMKLFEKSFRMGKLFLRAATSSLVRAKVLTPAGSVELWLGVEAVAAVGLDLALSSEMKLAASSATCSTSSSGSSVGSPI